MVEVPDQFQDGQMHVPKIYQNAGKQKIENIFSSNENTGNILSFSELCCSTNYLTNF